MGCYYCLVVKKGHYHIKFKLIYKMVFYVVKTIERGCNLVIKITCLFYLSSKTLVVKQIVFFYK
jgi:hypothetical protein